MRQRDRKEFDCMKSRKRKKKKKKNMILDFMKLEYYSISVMRSLETLMTNIYFYQHLLSSF